MNKRRAASMEFVRTELLPEAVHNRCFCVADSREFVEFVSATVEPLETSYREDDNNDVETEYYRARLTVNFSGEPATFALIIKLLSHGDADNRAYDKFMNEEMFYGKMTKLYNLDSVYPKCWLADMGRYGRPVVVLEDLEARGYRRLLDGGPGKLDERHLRLCLRAIARFHRRGLALRAEKFNAFREFYAKLIDTRLDSESPDDLRPEASNRILEILTKLLRSEGPAEIDSEASDETRHVTICHGRLAPRSSFYFAHENGEPVDVRVIGWNGMRYCSVVCDLVAILGDYLAANDETLERLLSAYVGDL